MCEYDFNLGAELIKVCKYVESLCEQMDDPLSETQRIALNNSLIHPISQLVETKKNWREALEDIDKAHDLLNEINIPRLDLDQTRELTISERVQEVVTKLPDGPEPIILTSKLEDAIVGDCMARSYEDSNLGPHEESWHDIVEIMKNHPGEYVFLQLGLGCYDLDSCAAQNHFGCFHYDPDYSLWLVERKWWVENQERVLNANDEWIAENVYCKEQAA